MTEMNQQAGGARDSARLGILTAGMGAIATTLIGGVAAVKQGLAKPIGALTQMSHAVDADGQRQPLGEYLGLPRLGQLRFGGWDISNGTCYDAAQRAAVLEPLLLQAVRPELESIEPMAGIHDPQYLRRAKGQRLKPQSNKFEQAEALRADIRAFRQQQGVEQVVVEWCGSTEVFMAPGPAHQNAKIFETALKQNEATIAPSMIYAYAALMEGCPFVNATPTLTVDLPVMIELAQRHGAPVCGKDLKTGQTLLKTILAPGLKKRALGINGWFSMNILGNQDGAVLDDPAAFRSKEESKLSALNHILEPELYPDLYGQISHQVKINYYPPRGDNKESWDTIDVLGWLGYAMQIKVDFLCRDSILAAPLLLDLALLSAAAQAAGRSGAQEWLGFYFKSPQTQQGRPEHDLSVQYQRLQDALGQLAAERRARAAAVAAPGAAR
ncbi:MAG: inositol-3-phosphate synthase [Terriglobales bacterium]